MRSMKLDRPVVFLDLETTGINPREDRIVEISLIRYDTNYEYEERTVRVNPRTSIPAGASAVHGITNEDVKDAPTFRQIAKSFLEFLGDSDIVGYNAIRFDIPLLKEEFKRCGLDFETDTRRIVDPMVIFYKKEPRDLSAAYQKYCGEILQGAHGALVDTLAVKDIMLGQIGYYGDIGTTLEELHNYCHARNSDWIDEGGKILQSDYGPMFGFGKYHGHLISEVVENDPDYIYWALHADFDPTVKEYLNAAKPDTGAI